jgi:hypothetical protein
MGTRTTLRTAATNPTGGEISSLQSFPTERLSVASDGTQGNAGSFRSEISADGRVVAYTSLASNLVPGDTNGLQDIFMFDRQTHTTERASVASDGTQANGFSGFSSLPTIGGTFLSTLFVGCLISGFQLLNISSYWVSGVQGVLILLVVAATSVLRRRVSEP